MTGLDALETFTGGLIVSCQAYPGEPLAKPGIMPLMALAAQAGGAVGIRAQGLQDVAAVHEAVEVAQIGLWKVGHDGVFITPTLAHALRVAEAGAEIVAIDGTSRARPDGLSLSDTIRGVHEGSSSAVLADIATVEDGLAAADSGADAVATTLSHHVAGQEGFESHLSIVRRLVANLSIPVIAEGKVSTPEEARRLLDEGAFAVVVGTAITHVTSITERFVRGFGNAGIHG